jgi:glyceraldehyde 3-phosphate dehydrogenase
LRVDGREIPVFAEADPAALPWGEVGAEVVIESSGFFRDRAGAAKHLEAGARKVIISAPAKDPDVTVALGVNFDQVYDPERHDIISNASCTPRRHDHRARLHLRPAAARRAAQGIPPRPQRGQSLVPTSTGAAKAIGLLIPELAGRLQGFAVRVPVPTASLVDLTVEVEHETSAQAVNNAIRERADEGQLSGVLAYSEDPLVSTDIVRSPYSSIFDSGLTLVTGGTQVKVLAWYDNEWGYSSRLVDLAQHVAVPVAAPA